MRGELLQRITTAQENERKRIARELHDGTGQALTGLALGLRGLAVQMGKTSDSLTKRLGVLEAMATDSLGELHHLINDMRPPQLDDIGLVAALRWLTERFEDRDKPSLKLEIIGDGYTLPSEVETTLFRIAQEGLTNAIKHAHANHIWITLNFEDGPSLCIRDDGVGFDTKTPTNPSRVRTAWGIVGMQERSNLINATFTVDSKIGEGTSFTVHLSDPKPQELLNACKNINC